MAVRKKTDGKTMAFLIRAMLCPFIGGDPAQARSGHQVGHETLSAEMNRLAEVRAIA